MSCGVSPSMEGLGCRKGREDDRSGRQEARKGRPEQGLPCGRASRTGREATGAFVGARHAGCLRNPDGEPAASSWRSAGVSPAGVGRRSMRAWRPAVPVPSSPGPSASERSPRMAGGFETACMPRPQCCGKRPATATATRLPTPSPCASEGGVRTRERLPPRRSRSASHVIPKPRVSAARDLPRLGKIPSLAYARNRLSLRSSG